LKVPTNEQALLCLFHKEKSTRSDVDHLLTKWRITVVFSNCVGLVDLAI